MLEFAGRIFQYKTKRTLRIELKDPAFIGYVHRQEIYRVLKEANFKASIVRVREKRRKKPVQHPPFKGGL